MVCTWAPDGPDEMMARIPESAQFRISTGLVNVVGGPAAGRLQAAEDKGKKGFTPPASSRISDKRGSKYVAAHCLAHSAGHPGFCHHSHHVPAPRNSCAASHGWSTDINLLKPQPPKFQPRSVEDISIAGPARIGHRSSGPESQVRTVESRK